MHDMLELLNDISPAVKYGWLFWFAWAGVLIVWYRRARGPRPEPFALLPPMTRHAAPANARSEWRRVEQAMSADAHETTA